MESPVKVELNKQFPQERSSQLNHNEKMTKNSFAVFCDSRDSINELC